MSARVGTEESFSPQGEKLVVNLTLGNKRECGTPSKLIYHRARHFCVMKYLLNNMP